jgi:hypothetical protein
MKANEHSDNKNRVEFDESKNIIKEFYKQDKIDNSIPPKKEKRGKQKKQDKDTVQFNDED